MTNKEAIKIINNMTNYKPWEVEALYMAIKALERTDVLDKIREEIEEYKSRQLTLAIGVADLEKGKQTALEYVLAILDKYKAEGEDKE